jgi:hypothetical protein
MLEVKKDKGRNNKNKRVTKAYLDPFVFLVIATVSLLIYIHFEIHTAFAEKRHIANCHATSLVASEALDDTINDVEYYEFLFKACVREAGYAL